MDNEKNAGKMRNGGKFNITRKNYKMAENFELKYKK